MVYFLCKAYDSDRQNCYFALSLPVRGAWVEILCGERLKGEARSLPVRGAWVEMLCDNVLEPILTSLPVRGAWVEMMWSSRLCACFADVAPRAGSVG